MKEKRGVSLVAIVILVAIIIVITTSAIFEYKSIVIKAQKRELATEFYTMQQLINDYEFVNSRYPVLSEINVKKPDSEQFAKEPDPDGDGMITLKPIDYHKLNVESLTRGIKVDNDANDIYAMSSWTNNIYYLKGVTIEGTTYYTLTSELQKLLEISDVK